MSANHDKRFLAAMRMAMGVGLSAAMFTAPPLKAAQEPDDDETTELAPVEVTGTRLSLVNVEGANPVTVLTRDDITRIGYDSVGQLLQSLPSMSGSPVNTYTNNGGDGSTAVSLRGLGDERTLVLINGRRADFAGDLNTIPIALIDRVEVLKEGASAIYGADAVAGVVNIITRQNFEGMEMSATYSDWKTTTAPTLRYSAVTGGNTDRGNFVVGFDFVDQEAAFQDELDSPWMQRPLFIVDGDAYRQRGFIEGDTIAQTGSSSNPGGYFYGDLDGDGEIDDDAYTLNYEYTGSGQDPGTGEGREYATGDSIDDFHVFGTGPVDAYNFNPDNYIQTPSKRISFFLQGNYEIADAVNLFAEAQFQHRESEQFLAPLPYFADAGDPGYPITAGAMAGFNGVSADNYYNPFGVDVTARRRIVELRGRIFNQVQDAYRAVIGLEGTFADRWDYEVSYNYSETLVANTDNGQFYGPRLEFALGPSGLNGGEIVCGQPDAAGNVADADVIAGCVPLNLFGGPGTITQEMIDYISVALNDRTDSRTDVIHASISGDLFSLPAGWMQGAVGVERRREKLVNIPDSSKAFNVVTGNAFGPTIGSKEVESVFIEFGIPLLADAPLAEMLAINGGFRRDEFNTFGSADSYNIGIRWQPVEDILVRATQGTSYREPTIFDLYSAQGDSFIDATDPCGQDSGDGAVSWDDLTPDQRQNCIASGVPGDPNDPAGGYNDDSIIQIPTRIGGNPNVQPEEGESFTFGIGWAPSALTGFSVTLDYWDFEVTNTISSLATQTILDNCAFTGIGCELIARRSNGAIINVTALTDNLGRLTAKGIDLEVDYAHDTGFGSFDHRLLITQLTERTFQESSAAEVAELSGKFDNTFIGDSSFPETRLVYTTDWLLGQFGASARLEWISSLEDSNDEELGTIEVPSVTYLDLIGHWFVNTGTTLDLGVTNVTDEEAPFINSAFNANIDESLHRPMGLGYFLRVTQRF